jgi:hypothetical protein
MSDQPSLSTARHADANTLMKEEQAWQTNLRE